MAPYLGRDTRVSISPKLGLRILDLAGPPHVMFEAERLISQLDNPGTPGAACAVGQDPPNGVPNGVSIGVPGGVPDPTVEQAFADMVKAQAQLGAEQARQAAEEMRRTAEEARRAAEEARRAADRKP